MKLNFFRLKNLLINSSLDQELKEHLISIVEKVIKIDIMLLTTRNSNDRYVVHMRKIYAKMLKKQRSYLLKKLDLNYDNNIKV